MLKIRVITSSNLGKWFGTEDYHFQKSVNDTIEEITNAGGTVLDINYNTNQHGRIQSIVLKYES